LGAAGMKGVCPICGRSYRISKKRAEHTAMLSRVKYLYEPIDYSNNLFVWPCSEHVEEFERIMNEINRVKEMAIEEYRAHVSERISRIKKHVFILAKNIVRSEAEKLKNGEGIIIWVCDGEENDGKYRDLAVAYVKEKGRVRRVYGGLGPKTSFEKGKPFAMTHYIAQDIEILLSKPYIWRGIIQGILLYGEALKETIRDIFFLTHTYPRASLNQLLRHVHTLHIRSAEKIDELYALVDRSSIEREIARSIEEKYGVPPVTVLVPEHLVSYLARKEDERRSNEELVSV